MKCGFHMESHWKWWHGWLHVCMSSGLCLPHTLSPPLSFSSDKQANTKSAKHWLCGKYLSLKLHSLGVCDYFSPWFRGWKNIDNTFGSITHVENPFCDGSKINTINGYLKGSLRIFFFFFCVCVCVCFLHCTSLLCSASAKIQFILIRLVHWKLLCVAVPHQIAFSFYDH